MYSESDLNSYLSSSFKNTILDSLDSKSSINDVVVLKTHDNSQIIQRISKIQNREIRVSGDNSEYDSRYYSQKFNSDSVLGKVFFKI